MRATTVGSGLTVVTEHMPGVRSLALGFWVGTGSVDEAPALSGASHFLEHLLFKGTETRTARSIADAIDGVGGDMNAFTTKEYTAFYVRLLADDTDLALDILDDIIWSPAFRSDELELERQVILEEILMRADEPADLVHELFAAARFPAHPLGRDVLGDESSVRQMTRDGIAAFHAAHYRPGNLVVAAAGEVDHERITRGIRDRMPAWADGAARAAPVRQPPGAPPEQTALAERPT
ncbi:MAG: insulinase family protein, partial [Acidimicrobiaceae bacterium]|nr:insulinase family protein [Acidimicrobiaceae bacterium]